MMLLLIFFDIAVAAERHHHVQFLADDVRAGLDAVLAVASENQR
jgi:hypothetical protein